MYRQLPASSAVTLRSQITWIFVQPAGVCTSLSDTIPYAQSYREYLPELAKLLPGIKTPVRIVAGADDQVVPGSNAEFLHERLPNAKVDLIAGAGHFCWEEKPAEYAALLTTWWERANRGVEKLNQRTRGHGA